MNNKIDLSLIIAMVVNVFFIMAVIAEKIAETNITCMYP